MFATRVNVKVDKSAFYVGPESEGTDAFSYNRGDVNFSYVFPQFSIIQLLLRKIEYENVEGVIFVPLFTTQAWFTRLTRILVSDPLLFPPSKKALYFPYMKKIIPEIPNVKLLNY